MDKLKEKIKASLDDVFLSRDEAHDILETLKEAYLSAQTRIELMKYATWLASEKTDATNYPFVFKWLKKVSRLLGDFGTNKMHNNAYFSHKDDIRGRVIEVITNAGKSLDICLFTITDNLISGTITDVFRKGIATRIITDDEKIMDRGSDIFRFKHEGIQVKIDTDKSLMHHKFAIIDRLNVITGSYNWTRTASESNNENIIVTDNYRIVEAYIDEFERLWDEMNFL